MPAKLIDIKDQKFGRLLVLEYLGKKLWRCHCDCGNEHNAIGADLRSGKTSSCGCLQRELTSQRSCHDLQGNKYGRLIVVKSLGTDKWNHQIWECQCECGDITTAGESALEFGDTQSCGCYMRECMSERRKLYLEGRIFGSLTCVDNIGQNKKGHCLWSCRCVCGKMVITTAGSLISGNTGSCGCGRRHDIVGQRFGKLKVVRYLAEPHWSSLYECICDCGNICKTCSAELKRGNVKSCGCIGMSLGEYRIQEYLSITNCSFDRQYKTNQCKNIRHLLFDFRVIKKQELFIEFHGPQHYRPICFRKTQSESDAKKRFELQVKCDLIKEEWCCRQHHPLLIIPYWNMNRTEDLLTEFLKDR